MDARDQPEARDLVRGPRCGRYGGTIKRVTEHLDPRHTTVVALSKPSEREQGQRYFQRLALRIRKLCSAASTRSATDNPTAEITQGSLATDQASCAHRSQGEHHLAALAVLALTMIVAFALVRAWR